MQNMEFINTSGIEHQVQKGDWYKFILNNLEEATYYFYITNITQHYIEFRYFYDIGITNGENLWISHYNPYKKGKKRKDSHLVRRKIRSRLGGIMISNEHKMNYDYSTSDYIVLCADNKVNIDYENARVFSAK